MTLTEIRRLLDDLGARPKRRFGQNFMFDQNMVQYIVDLAEIKKPDHVLEIGPGLGALTEVLAKKTSNLTVIEHDQTFIPLLQEKFPDATVIHGDALEKISDFGFQMSDYSVISNLPYSVASPLMIRLCELDLRPKRMVFTVQLEVAERLVAQTSTKDYGLLTLLTQAFYDIRLERKIPPTVFWPMPEVDSAVVVMDRKSTQPFQIPGEDIVFREISKKAFQKRRKTLGSIFGKELPSEIDRTKRPENLSMDEWINFAKKRMATIEEYFDVVDENDRVVGQKSRSEVHRTKLLHRAIHIFVWNQKGELLLQKRSPWKDMAPNTWDSSAAGHLGVGESYDAAAEREIVEELGVDIPIRRDQYFKACAELGWEFVWLYSGKSEGPFRFPKSEISEVRWWNVSEIDEAVRKRPQEFAKSFVHIWQNRSS
jgi:16S rRNA (adenine1518-N6/adenine1519-N6)-dimethyltransferase